MGQYHLIANLNKREYLNPQDFDDGLKLWEFNTGKTVIALTALLASSNQQAGGDFSVNSKIIGSWAGDSIAIIGDYQKPERLNGLTYNIVESDFENIGEKIIEVLRQDRTFQEKFLNDKSPAKKRTKLLNCIRHIFNNLTIN